MDENMSAQMCMNGYVGNIYAYIEELIKREKQYNERGIPWNGYAYRYRSVKAYD